MRVDDDVRRQIVDLLPRLRRFARTLTGDADRGDDLVQETCVRALSRLDQWQKGTRLDSWLYRIAQNAWLDQMRATKVRGEKVDLETAIEVSGEDGRETVENRLVLSDVARALTQLPPDQHIVVGLVCIEGLSYVQAAEITEVPLGTVMSRLARARRALMAATHAIDAGAEPQVAEKRRGQTVG